MEQHCAAFSAALCLALGADRDWTVRAAALAAATAFSVNAPPQGVPAELGTAVLLCTQDTRSAAVRTAALDLAGSLLAGAPPCPGLDREAAIAQLARAETADANSGVRGAASRALARARGTTAMES